MVLPPPGGSETSRNIFATAGFVAGCGSGACRHALAAPTIPGDDEGSSDTKTGVRSCHNPYHQGKGESWKHLAAHQEQEEDGKESQTAGQDRSREGLIDGLVDHVSERLVAQQPVVLTEAIEDDDRDVHGIADQSKQGRDDRKRNLKMQQREKAQGNKHIVKHGQNRRQPKNHFIEQPKNESYEPSLRKKDLADRATTLQSKGNIYQHAAQP